MRRIVIARACLASCSAPAAPPSRALAARGELDLEAGHRFSIAGREGEEIVFVPGPSGSLDHIFTGSYSARRRR